MVEFKYGLSHDSPDLAFFFIRIQEEKIHGTVHGPFQSLGIVDIENKSVAR